MRHHSLSKLLLPALCALVSVPASAQFTYIVESRDTGQNFANYTDAGFANSSGVAGAPGCTATGTRYSPTGASFGPTRYAQFSFTPTITGFYEIDLAWPMTAGHISTAVNLYTGNATGGDADRWGNAGGPQGIVFSGTMDMFNKNAGIWNVFTTAELTVGTTYKTGIYGGYATPYAGGVTPADPSANRVAAGAVRYMAATPGAVTYTGLADEATDVPLTGEGNELSWTAGAFDSFFDIYLSTTSGSLTKVGTVDKSTLSFDLDSQNLIPGTQYFWRVDAGNVDVFTPGMEFSFIAVPEPSIATLGLLGGLCCLVWSRRHRAG